VVDELFSNKNCHFPESKQQKNPSSVDAVLTWKDFEDLCVERLDRNPSERETTKILPERDVDDLTDGCDGSINAPSTGGLVSALSKYMRTKDWGHYSPREIVTKLTAISENKRLNRHGDLPDGFISVLLCRVCNHGPGIYSSWTSEQETTPSTVSFGSRKICGDGHSIVTNNHFHAPVTNVAQGEHIDQTLNVNFTPEDIIAFVRNFSEHLPELALTKDETIEAEAQLAVLKTHSTGRFDIAGIKEAARSLSRIAEGAIGNILATVVTSTDWHRLAHMLRSLAS
jgi:hypothetical protein